MTHRRFVLPFILFFCFSLMFFGCSGGGSGGGRNAQDISELYSIDGYIQKGPFLSRSSVTIQELDENINPTEAVYLTNTER